MTVILNTAQAANPNGYSGANPVDATVPVQRASDGIAYVEIYAVEPSEALVLINYP